MASTLALTKAELRRLMHNKRYFIFTVGFPVVLYLLISRQVSAQAYGIAFGAYYMIAMATFGAFSGALNGNAQRISQEKKDGWIRQLRLTPLPANAYVVTKILVSLAGARTRRARPAQQPAVPGPPPRGRSRASLRHGAAGTGSPRGSAAAVRTSSWVSAGSSWRRRM